MDPLNEDMLRRASEYCEQYALTRDRRLGAGKDGSVWATQRDSAVKCFHRPEPYRREVAAYRRLAEQDVVAVLGHAVPQVIRIDDVRLVIEMTIVRPPFVLDFASVWLDEPPQFPPEILEAWEQERMEQFGDRWGQAVGVLAALRRLGLHMTDVHPGNIGFAEDDEA